MPSNPEPPAASPRRRPPRSFKWTRRVAYFCGWFVCMVVCLGALAAGLALVTYRNATPIANIARAELAADYPIEIGSLTFPEAGLVELRDVVVDLPDGGGRAGKIERIQLRYDASDILKPRARSLVVENPDFTLDDRLLGMFAPKEDDDPDSPPAKLDWAKLDSLKVINGQIRLDLKGIPRGTWHVDLEADDIDLSSDGNLLSARPQRVVLRDVLIEDPAGSGLPPLISADKITADLSLHKDFTSGAVASLRLEKPTVRFTPKLIASLQSPPEENAPTQKQSAPSEPGEPMRWSIAQLALEDGFFAMTDFYDTPDLSFRHTGVFTDLNWTSDAGLSWPTRQETAITDVRLDARALPLPAGEFENAETPVLASIPRIEIAGVPDEFFTHGWIEKVAARDAKIDVTEENIRRFLTAAPKDPTKILMPPGDPGEASAAPPASDDGPPFMIRPRHLELVDAKVTAEADGFLTGLPDTQFTLNIRSAAQQPDDKEDLAYELSATKFYVSAHQNPIWANSWKVLRTTFGVRQFDIPKNPIIDGREVFSEFTAAGIQRDNRIESVNLSGIKVSVGKQVETLIADLSRGGGLQPPAPQNPAKTPDPAKPIPEPGVDPIPDTPAKSAATEDDSPEWKIGRLDFEETRFALENFIPGLPYVPLVIETSLKEVPLSGRDRGDERLQRIELRRLEIASTENTLIPVAKLNSIWIHFTIPGLIRNEIERIEIVNPEIYLGEHLFWYVDYYRKLSEGETAVDDQGNLKAEVVKKEEVPEEKPAAVAPDKGKITVVEEALKNTEISGWKIKIVEASAGKLIVAPKGYPIGILPFPFTAKTNLAAGEIELDLKVPSGDYMFEQLKLELEGLSGEAFFNYPIRAENNNFVQTFTVPNFRFQDYKADEVYLSVTYDENGIYGKLGGKAYGGYAEGEFNIYIGETYKWDAWVAGTKLDLAPITDILSPENVRATGILNAKIIANGEGFIPEKVTGEMQTSGKCHMHVTKLDDVLKSLPEPRFPKQEGRKDITTAMIDPLTTALQHALSKAGIEAFQHYDFTTGSAKLELDGRDGTASMLLDGPDGKRNLMFTLHDKRELAGPVKQPQ